MKSKPAVPTPERFELQAMPIKAAPYDSKPVLRKGIYKDPSGVLYTCDRYEHYFASPSGIRIYATTANLCDPECVITGYSLIVDHSHISFRVPRQGAIIPTDCLTGYVQVCTPSGDHCWCEWLGAPE